VTETVAASPGAAADVGEEAKATSEDEVTAHPPPAAGDDAAADAAAAYAPRVRFVDEPVVVSPCAADIDEVAKAKVPAKGARGRKRAAVRRALDGLLLGALSRHFGAELAGGVRLRPGGDDKRGERGDAALDKLMQASVNWM